MHKWFIEPAFKRIVRLNVIFDRLTTLLVISKQTSRILIDLTTPFYLPYRYALKAQPKL